MSKLSVDFKSKTCVDCGEFKQAEEIPIHKSPNTKSGFIQLPRCKDCNSLWKLKSHLERTYGLTWEEYLKMVDEQEGKCFLCYQKPKKGKRLVVDHCHRSGEVRKLLCTTCNVFLARVERDPDYIERLKDYI